jgi:hypothetical protein
MWRRIGPEERRQVLGRRVRVQPSVTGVILQHYRHPVVVRAHLRARVSGDDGEGPEDLAVGRPPALPEPSEGQHASVAAAMQ